MRTTRRNIMIALVSMGLVAQEGSATARRRKMARATPCTDACFCMPRVDVFQCGPEETDQVCCRRYVSVQCGGRDAACRARWRQHCADNCAAG